MKVTRKVEGNALSMTLRVLVSIMLAVSLIPANALSAYADEAGTKSPIGGAFSPVPDDSGQGDTAKSPSGESSYDETLGLGGQGTLEQPATLATVKGTAWLDANSDGLKDNGEEVVSGIWVYLKTNNVSIEDKDEREKDPSVIEKVLTKEDGTYIFENITPDTYYLYVETEDTGYLPAQGKTFAEGIDDSLDNKTDKTGHSKEIILEAGEKADNINAALVLKDIAVMGAEQGQDQTLLEGTGTVSGIIWNDTNKDGMRGADEPTIDSCVVELYDSEGSFVDSTATQEDGVYEFSNIAPGTYRVQITAQYIRETEYLPLLKEVEETDDNCFSTDATEAGLTATSELIEIVENSAITQLDAALCTSMVAARSFGMMPLDMAGGYVVSGGATGTFNNLIAAVTACPTTGVPCTITVMADDLNMGTRAIVSNGQVITLTSGPGGPYKIVQTNSASSGAARHFEVIGSLTLDNITLEGMGVASGSVFNGGVKVIGYAGNCGTLTINTGTVIRYCYNGSDLNGAAVESQSSFYANGTYVLSTVIMNGGEIYGNVAGRGGGVYGINFMMNGGTISGNTATMQGGGVYGAITMNGGTITGNNAPNGGGLYLTNSRMGAANYPVASTISAGTISNNIASNDGGGIFVQNYSYANPAATTGYGLFSVEPQVTFSGNASGAPSTPPSNYSDFTTRAGYSFDGLLLNNDDVNYGNPNYAVTYRENNGTTNNIYYQSTNTSTGSVTIVTVEHGSSGANFSAPAGKVFKEWNTAADGSGTSYSENQSVPISGNLELFAIWTDIFEVVEQYHSDQAGTQISGYPDVTTSPFSAGDTINQSVLNGKIMTIPGYTYTGYILGGAYTVDTLSTGPTIASIAADTTITYVYSLNSHTVTYHLVDRSGNDVAVPSVFEAPASESVSQGGQPTRLAPSGMSQQLVYVGYNIDNSSVPTAGEPRFSVTGATDVYLIYGQDKVGPGGNGGSNGIEDVTFSVVHEIDPGGTPVYNAVAYDYSVTRDIGETWTASATAVTGYTATGNHLDFGGHLQVNDPSITVSLTDAGGSLVFLYDDDGTITITEHYVSRTGVEVATTTYKYPSYGASYTGVAPAVAEHVYVGYQTTAPTTSAPSTVVGGTLPSTNPTLASAEYWFIYGQDKGNTGDDGDGGPYPPDSKEDVIITRQAITTGGGLLTTNHSPLRIIMNVEDGPYTDPEAGVTDPEWKYEGWNITGSPSVYNPGVPNVALQGGLDVTVTYVYSLITYPVTIAYVDRNGSLLTPLNPSALTSVNLAYGASFLIPPEPVANYTLVDWGVNGTLQGNTITSLTMPAAPTVVALVYGQDNNNNGIEDFTITVNHVTQADGGKIVPEEEVYVDITDTYTGHALTNPIYTLADILWDGSSVGAITPYIEPNINDDHAIIFQYTPSSYPVTVSYEYKDGSALSGPDQNTQVSHGNSFTPTIPVFAEMVFIGWRLNGVAQTGTPTVPSATQYADIVLVYGQDKTNDGIEDFTITEEYYDANGIIAASREIYVNKGLTYTASPQSIAGYVYANAYHIDGGSEMAGTAQITGVASDHTVRLMYRVQDATPTPPPAPPTTDYENYEFVKKPNVKNVVAGEIVSYTFAGFGNKWSFPVDRYAITDKPDKGLDFKSASMPAFNNGAGVTYDVVYITNQNGKRTLYSAIPANSPFYFEAPVLASGEYITGITLSFGTVPSGFAVGDTMTWTFRVWDNPPATTLTNVGVLSYMAGNDYKEYMTGDSGTVFLAGWFTPKTGDAQEMLIGLFLMLCVAAVLALIAERVSRRRFAQASLATEQIRQDADARLASRTLNKLK